MHVDSAQNNLPIFKHRDRCSDGVSSRVKESLIRVLWFAHLHQSSPICQSPDFGISLEKGYLWSPMVPPGHHRCFSGKESACNAGDTSLIPRLERAPGGGNGNPL